MSGGPNTEQSDAENVYVAPEMAEERARAVLDSTDASVDEQAAALLVLGRAAYYANRIDDAVGLLREATNLNTDDALAPELVLTLAPALSKQGEPDQALDMLDSFAQTGDDAWDGQLANQRGIVLCELGRLLEAHAAFERALELHRLVHDSNREARTLVNLGAVASMMGDLDGAARWYELGRAKTMATDQQVVAAAIEGNLGYVEGRRGNYAQALNWYRQARSSFDEFGDVALLTANLELDHAHTLLAVGLYADAIDAAGRAVTSAISGGNQMLETQARLALGEAHLRSGDIRSATNEIDAGRALATSLGQETWALRGIHLGSLISRDRPSGDVASQLDQLVAAGWTKEAWDVVAHHANRAHTSDPDFARSLVARSIEWNDYLDPLDRSLAELLLADLDGNSVASQDALGSALSTLDEQRQVLGSLEMRAALSHRIVPLRDTALRTARRSDHPGPQTLDILEAVRRQRGDVAAQLSRPGPNVHDVELRRARIALDDAKLNDGDVPMATRNVRECERAVLRAQRTDTGIHSPVLSPDPADISLDDDTSYVTFVGHGEDVLAVVVRDGVTSLVEVGAWISIRPLITRIQRSLRRLADERSADTTAEFLRLQDSSQALDLALFRQLALSTERIVLTPGEALFDVPWSALPTLRCRCVTLANSLGDWGGGADALSVGNSAFLAGPDLAGAQTEIADCASYWPGTPTVVAEATATEALDAMGRHDLVHVSAHGLFQAHNPFFSSLEFFDGPVTLLDLASSPTLPTMLILASCDAGAASSSHAIGGVVVGTATELRNLGVDVVVAPTGIVNDALSASFMSDFHAALAAGVAPDAALRDGRAAAVASGDPRAQACAFTYVVIGTSAASSGLTNSI